MDFYMKFLWIFIDFTHALIQKCKKTVTHWSPLVGLSSSRTVTECLKKTFDWKDIYHEIQQHTQPAECAVLFTEMKAMCLLCIRDNTAKASSTQINDINI